MEFDGLPAYTAGFIDGEGSISSHVVSISQIMREPLDIIFSRYGGVINQMKSPTSTGKLIYVLRFRQGESLKLLEEILPYLIVKREKAIECLEYLRLRQSNGKLGRNRNPSLPDDVGAHYQKLREEYRIIKEALKSVPDGFTTRAAVDEAMRIILGDRAGDHF